MSKVHNLISDVDIDQELLRGLKNRKLDQKHFYITAKAVDLYYRDHAIPRPYFEGVLTPADYKDFFFNIIANQINNFALISLGCGDAGFESNLFKDEDKNKTAFVYIGVDSSRNMLELAEEKMNGIVESEFVCADFSALDFNLEVPFLIDEFKNKLFALFGGTVGNMMPTSIVGTLSNMLAKGDMIWIVAGLRAGTEKENDFKAFENYVGYINDPVISEFNFFPLKRIGVPYSSGKMTIDMETEAAIGALLFVFGYQFDKKTVVSFRDEKIFFLPGDRVELLSIRLYDPEKFKEFFFEYGFDCIASQKKGNMGQFLFKKV